VEACSLPLIVRSLFATSTDGGCGCRPGLTTECLRFWGGVASDGGCGSLMPYFFASSVALSRMLLHDFGNNRIERGRFLVND